LAICATLVSFRNKPGGEGFEIFLNNKVVVQQFGNDMSKVKNIQLTQSLAAGQLTIKYHHCGRIGKNRIVTVKDAHNKVLKEFNYADAATPVAVMTVNLKDLLNLMKGNNQLKLYYSSSELPNGRMLVSISKSTINTTAP
ncbi:MAG TPA: hypothetical protein PLX74_10850, partial [Chitinophagaceae bacterium]|nr:hypothetical protein [Chitinophagaceae bacterium]